MRSLDRFEGMPSVMSAAAELAVIRALRSLPTSVLRAKRDAFVDVVNRLDESHARGSPA